MPVLCQVPRKIRDTLKNKIKFVYASESFQDGEECNFSTLLCHREHAVFLGGSFFFFFKEGRAGSL